MLKKIVLVLAVIVLPMALFASAEVINSDHWAYKDIKSLVDAGVITKALDKDTLTRDEVVGYINDGVHNMLYAEKGPSSRSTSNSELSKQIDKLYELVKAYMTDMLKTQQKLDDILNTIGDLKVKKAELEKKQDKLLSSLGMRIDGESSGYMTDLLIYGPDMPTPNALRYRPINQYLDLMFSLHSSKELYAEATFRLENYFGGYWGSYDIIGLKRYFVQGNYPISFVVGDYQAKLTPFTIWAVDEDRPFEAKLYSDKRDMNKKELYLYDNSWPVTGAKIETIVTLIDSLDIDMQVQAARLQEADNGVDKPAPLEVYDPGANTYSINNPAMDIYNHDQYMIAGRIASDFMLNKLLNGLAKIKLGVNYVDIQDAKDTGDNAQPEYYLHALDNSVASVDLSVTDIYNNMVKLNAEFAMSNYTPDKFVINYAAGTALKAEVQVDAFDTTLKAGYIANDVSFTAFAAQTRMFDAYMNNFTNLPGLSALPATLTSSLYLTQNNSWNIAPKTTGGTPLPPTYQIGGHYYPFTEYNGQINVSYNGVAGNYGNLLSYPIYDDNVMPYGDATPDRMGEYVKLSGSYLDEMIQPVVNFKMMSETYGYQRQFMLLEGGAKINLGQVSIKGGYRMENTQSNNLSSLNLVSNIIDAGVEYYPIKNKLTLFLGMKDITYSGQEFVLGNGSTVPVNVDASAMSYGGGIEYFIAKPAVVGLSYTVTTLTDNIADLTDGVQELDARLSINF